jgi:uncharacterized protein YdhG (YjbR/CyaY superfamily)
MPDSPPTPNARSFAYLALESILDHLAPQRTTPPLEREGEWFRRALTEAGKLVNLAGHAPRGVPDPVEALYDELYLSTRNLVFHAKATRAYLLPHGSPERRALEETARRAAYLYIALAEKVIHLRPPGSGWFAGAWRMLIDGLALRLGIVLTNDPAPFSADDTTCGCRKLDRGRVRVVDHRMIVGSPGRVSVSGGSFSGCGSVVLVLVAAAAARAGRASLSLGAREGDRRLDRAMGTRAHRDRPRAQRSTWFLIELTRSHPQPPRFRRRLTTGKAPSSVVVLETERGRLGVWLGHPRRRLRSLSAEEVDQYLRGVEEPKRSTLAALRRAILEVVPDAEQVISYRVPAFRVRGETVAGFAAFQNHLSYLPFSGSVLPTLGEELEGYTMTKSALHFAVDRPLPKTLVKRLIAVRLVEVEPPSR